MKKPVLTEKTAIYHTLYQLNAAFAAIVGHCDALQQAGALTPKYKRLFQGFAQEVQAELNLEVLELWIVSRWPMGEIRQSS